MTELSRYEEFYRAPDAPSLGEDYFFMLYHREHAAFWYAPPGTSPTEAWENAVRWQYTFVTKAGPDYAIKWKKAMKAEGWVARKVVAKILT